MSRLGRILLNVATAVSLVLCVATGAMWAGSYPGERWATSGGPREVAVIVHRGRALVEARSHSVAAYPGVRPTRARGVNERDLALPPGWQHDPVRAGLWEARAGETVLGFGRQSVWFWRADVPAGVYRIERGENVAFPLWLPLGAFAALPAVGWLRSRVARERARAGLCVACGYDLRATPGRCPECGTISGRDPVRREASTH